MRASKCHEAMSVVLIGSRFVFNWSENAEGVWRFDSFEKLPSLIAMLNFATFQRGVCHAANLIAGD